MKSAVDSFARLEREVAAEMGRFALFALLAREELPDRWDLVVSAPWLGDHRQAVEFLVGEIKSRLGADHLVVLSRIVVVPPDAEAVQAINREIQVEHGRTEIRDTEFSGVQIRQGFFITSQPVSPAPI